MKSFLQELKKRNAILYFLGWIMFIAFFICLVASYFDKTIILGVDAWVKPMKFYSSIGIMSWTMGWLAYYLDDQKKVKAYSWIVVITMFIEMLIISAQSARGQQSHFNISTPANGILFSIMGIAITIFTLCTAFICFLFFRQKTFNISKTYLLSIRLAFIVFILFALEGWVMVAKLSHTVGGADGSPGLPFVNWSEEYGDLRVAHFFGMHALQILPLTGYYLARKNIQVILFAATYFVLVTLLLIEAINGIPLVK